MRLSYRTVPLWCGMLAVAILATACGAGSTESSLESRAQGINKSLMCPVCPSETIDQAQVELAAQMRTIVLERLAAGSGTYLRARESTPITSKSNYGGKPNPTPIERK